MRISLFMPCFNDTLFPQTGMATVRVLERLGHDVVFPRAQTCCGQIHYNTGYRDEARRLMRHFLDVFDGAGVIVAPSASCVATVRDAYPELAEDAGEPGLARRVADLAPRVFELTEFLVRRLGVHDVGARFPHRVTYHPTCHSLRHLRLDDAPLRLLRAVDGLELADLPRAEECCGFGGTFAVKNVDTSLAMLDDKLAHVAGSRAAFVTAVDNSCLMQIGGGLRRRGLSTRAIHIAEILAAAP
ncbi:MAG TPA: (Fe-S)-binding protein [Longimicrobiales bacterium]|nr:(Fe-S)-binding protein [Longimicrobiales bacterium]